MKNFFSHTQTTGAAARTVENATRFFVAVAVAIVMSGVYSPASAQTAPSTYSAYAGTDAKTIPPAPSLGPANSVIVDPTFGSRILRVTDANTNGGESLISTDSGFHRTFNADSTAIKLTGPHGDAYWLEFNPSTFKVGDGSSKPKLHSLPFGAHWEWSATDPNVIYFLNGSKISKYNKATNTTTNLGGPPNGDPVTYHPVVIGPDNWVCSAAGTGYQDTYTEIFCVQPSNTSKNVFIDVQGKTINGVSQSDPNWPTPTSGQTIGIHDVSGGTGSSWLEVTFHQASWGANGNAVLDLSKNTWSLLGGSDPYWSGHVAIGNGKYANGSGSQSGTDSRGIILRDPNDLMNKSSQLFVFNPPLPPSNGWCDADHISWANSLSNPKAPILTSRYTLSTNCKYAWTGEIDLAAVDGSNKVWRFAHNHNGGMVCYFAQAFAQISNDGKWALFSSYWDGTLGADTSFGCSTRIDTFIVDLTGGSGSTVSSSDSTSSSGSSSTGIDTTTTPTAGGSSTSGTTTSGSSTSSSTTSGSSSSSSTTTAPSTTPPGSPATGRIEDDSSAVAYMGGFGWHTNTAGLYSGGSATGAPDAGARATVTFSGTGVSFIAYEDEWSGIANIYVDGTLKGQIDAYSSPFKAQSTLYSISGLNSGTHTLTVEATGTKNASSGGTWVWVDAFNTISGTATSGSGTTSAGSSSTSNPPVATSGGSTSTSGGSTSTSGGSTSTPGGSTSTPGGSTSTPTSPSTGTSSGSSSTSSSSTSGSTPSANNPAPLPIGGQSLTTSGSGSMQIGSAQVLASGGQALPSGVAIFDYSANGVLVSEAGVPATTASLRGRIYASISGSVNTGVAFANPNNSQATVSFFFTDDSGNNFGNGNLTIPAHGQIAHFLNEAPFSAPQPTSGTLTFSSDVPVSAIAIRGLTNERSEFLVTTLPVANLDSSPSGPVFFPHFADGGGWTTQFVLVNPSDRTINGTVNFYGQGTAGTRAPSLPLNIDGSMSSQITYSIPPKSSKRFSTSNTSSQMTVGTAQVIPAAFNPSPVGVAVFSYQTGGITVSEAGIPSTAVGAAFRMYAEADSSNATLTAVAVENVGSADSTVNFDLTRLDGSSLGLSGKLVIPSNGQRAVFLNEIPGFASIPQPFKGVLRISSANGNIAVLGVRSRWNQRGDFIFTTTPATNENAPADSQLIFPHIVDGGGYSTQFIMFSGAPNRPATGTLQLFSQTGSSLSINVK